MINTRIQRNSDLILSFVQLVNLVAVAKIQRVFRRSLSTKTKEYFQCTCYFFGNGIVRLLKVLFSFVYLSNYENKYLHGF